MGFQPHDFDEEWRGLEPEQPEQQQRSGVWIGVVVAVFFVGVCLVGAFLLVRQFLDRTGDGGGPVAVPTSPVEEEIVEEEDEATEEPDLGLAPTVTPANEDGGEVEQPPIGAGTVAVVRLSGSVKIDGDLSDWPEITTVTSAYRVFAAESWDGSEDLTAVWHLTYDDTNLYIGVDVTDDTHVQTQSGNQIFRGDSVDIQFDTDRAGDYAAQLSPDDYQITLSPGDFGGLPPSAFRFQGTADNRILDAPGGHHVTVAAQATERGYVLEAAIPWSDLNVTPEAGFVMGVALNANDDDVPGTAVQEVMMSHVSTRTLRNPTGWGTLTLK
jgi:hypothetical protein